MPTILKTKNSVTTTVVPTTLQQGELAVNITDKKVWVGNAATTPVQLLGDGGSGSFTSIAFGAGTVSAPSITFTGDTNTGIYSPAADTIAFTEGGVESMRINSEGNVGIGATSPVSIASSKTLTIYDSTLSQIFLQNSTTGTTGNDGFSLAVSGSDAFLNNREAGNLITFVNGSERMRIDSSGNVGIGTSSPGQKLDIAVASGAGALQVSNTSDSNRGGRLVATGSSASGTFAVNTTSSGYGLTFGIDGTERMRIDTSGNVLLGTTSGFGQGSGRQLLCLNGTSSTNITCGVGGSQQLYLYSDTASTQLITVGSTPLIFGTSNNERMRIDSSGNVMIGSTTSSGTFYVNKATNDTAARFDTTFNNFSNVNVFSVLFGTNTNTTSCNHFNGYADGANRILIFGNGNIQNQNNSYAGISDIKLKENVTDTAPKLNKLNQVRVVNYNLKDKPDQKLLGVVAQELEQIFPSMVEEIADKDVDGNDLGTTTKSVKYSVFVPMLIKAMQEQQTLIENLTTRLNALEGK
jgi:hypothetical protein